MPTEHEFKYVLRLDDVSLKSLTCLSGACEQIEQGYLMYTKGTSARVRRRERSGKISWWFTFKQKVGERVIEIETEIDQRDGVDLWSACMGKLSKNRYMYVDGMYRRWEVDLFFDQSGEPYFLMAEVEVQEGGERPLQPPLFIQESLLYEVPLTDDRFSNKRLHDVVYAKNLYRLLHGGSHVEEQSFVRSGTE